MDDDSDVIEPTQSVCDRARETLETLPVRFKEGDIANIANQLGCFHSIASPRSFHIKKYSLFVKEYVIRAYYNIRAIDTEEYRKIVSDILDTVPYRQIPTLPNMYWTYVSDIRTKNPVLQERDKLISLPSGIAWYLYVFIKCIVDINRLITTISSNISEYQFPLPPENSSLDMVLLQSMVLMNKVISVGEDNNMMMYNKAIIVGSFVYAHSVLRTFQDMEVQNYLYIFNMFWDLINLKPKARQMLFVLACKSESWTSRHGCSTIMDILSEFSAEYRDEIYTMGCSDPDRFHLIMILAAHTHIMNNIRLNASASGTPLIVIEQLKQRHDYIGAILNREISIRVSDMERAEQQCGKLVNRENMRDCSILFGW